MGEKRNGGDDGTQTRGLCTPFANSLERLDIDGSGSVLRAIRDDYWTVTEPHSCVFSGQRRRVVKFPAQFLAFNIYVVDDAPGPVF